MIRWMSLSSCPSSSFIVSSSLPRELAAAKRRSETRGTIHVSPLAERRRSALETTFSRLAIDIRTETPDCWFTWGEVRASREASSTTSLT